MRFLYTVFAVVVGCSAAVLAQTPLAAYGESSDSQYTPGPAPSVGPYETPAPVIEETPAPVAEDASAPLVEETPAPVASVDAYETPAPIAEDASAPLTEETPAPIASVDAYETPAPVAEETPAPIAEDSSTLLTEETPAPVVEETPAADPSYYRRALRRQRQVDNTTDDSITTTTTARPAITITPRPGSNATEESGNATATCAANAVCFHDEDCGSTGDKKGRCLGFFNGKCNCNACLNFLTCKDDSACGGLQGACNTTTSRCSCDEGYKANGFAGGLLDAFRELCNVKDCTGENHADACFGLPCNSGRCIC